TVLSAGETGSGESCPHAADAAASGRRGRGPAVSGRGHGHGESHAVLSWQSGARTSGPLRPAEEALAAERHSLDDTAPRRDRGARERVEARSQPLYQPADRACLPAQSHRPGGPDPYPRAAAPKRRQPRHGQGTRRHPAGLAGAVLGTEWLGAVEGAPRRQWGRGGGGLPPQPVLPALWEPLAPEPPREGRVVRVPGVPA